MVYIVVLEDNLEFRRFFLKYFSKLPISIAESAEHARRLVGVAQNQWFPVFLIDTVFDGEKGGAIAKEILGSTTEFRRKPLILDTGNHPDPEMGALGIEHIGKNPQKIERALRAYEQSFRNEKDVRKG